MSQTQIENSSPKLQTLKIQPCLWFDSQAEEAANFYVSVFKNGSVGPISRYSEASSQGSGKPVGSVLTVSFEIEGQDFLALNGGPMFKFTEAISLTIRCDSQEEIDYFWNALIADGGEESYCGWLKDKFGLSWQVVPREIEAMITDPDSAKAERVLAAVMGMRKLDYAAIQRAYKGE